MAYTLPDKAGPHLCVASSSSLCALCFLCSSVSCADGLTLPSLALPCPPLPRVWRAGPHVADSWESGDFYAMRIMKV
eukprot:7007656-Prymnesium_polylepis.2